jgi:hypothetical protein
VTWIRVDANAVTSDVVGDLVAELAIHPMQAFGHYIATCAGFGQHRPDGLVREVPDAVLEVWAQWTGKRGRWAAAFRKRCEDENGQVRGWWRNSALLDKQERDRRKRKPPKNPRGFLGETPEKPREKMADDGGRRTEDVDETISSTLPGRLAQKLVGEPSRYAIVEFLEAVPAGQNAQAWAMCLNGCLEGIGTAQGRKATVDDLAAACNDYRATPLDKWGIPHFRSFVNRIVAARLRPHTSSEAVLPRSSTTDRAVAAVRAFVEDGE